MDRNYNAMNLIDSWALGVTMFFALTNGVSMYGMGRQYEEMLRRVNAAERLRPRLQATDIKPEIIPLDHGNEPTSEQVCLSIP